MATMYGLDERLAELTTDDILKTYNGRQGCACGCGGKYSYTDGAEGSAERGYPVAGDEVSVIRVRNVLRQIQSHPEEAVLFDYGSVKVWEYDTGRRVYRAYLRIKSQ